MKIQQRFILHLLLGFVTYLVLLSCTVLLVMAGILPMLFGKGWIEISGRSILYIIILWICTILLRQRKEVIRG